VIEYDMLRLVNRVSIGFNFENYLENKMISTTNKQSRVRCSDEVFLEAVFSSRTYAEIAAKTGQKTASTIARYARTKTALAKKGIELPSMERSKPQKNFDNVDAMAKIVAKIKESQNA